MKLKHLPLSIVATWLIVNCSEKNIPTENQIENTPPSKPLIIEPSNNQTDIDIAIYLKWHECNDENDDEITYDIYFDETINPRVYATDITDTTYRITGLEYETKYYWKIIAKDDETETAGSINNFTTKKNIAEMFTGNWRYEYNSSICGNIFTDWGFTDNNCTIIYYNALCETLNKSYTWETSNDTLYIYNDFWINGYENYIFYFSENGDTLSTYPLHIDKLWQKRYRK